jgi:hypothetical protein
MEDADVTFGLNPVVVQSVFNTLLCFYFRSEDSSRPYPEFVDRFLWPEDSTLQSELLSVTSVIKHSELAFRTLSLQSLAFLADEQKDIFLNLKEALFEDWQRLLYEANLSSFGQIPSFKQLFLKIDAVYLCQLEWMKDVGFLNCPSKLRHEIFSESPLSEILMLEN